MAFAFEVLRLGLGFAISGAAASGFELVTSRKATFRLLRERDMSAVAAVPVVTIGAPYILMRNLLFAAPRPPTFSAALVGTVASGLYSLALGATALSAFAS